jgi:hypothetical protein
MKKLLTTLLFFQFGFGLSAQESLNKPTQIKDLKIYLIRNSGFFIPFEEDIYSRTFLNNRPSDKKKSINYYEFGFRKRFDDTDFYLDVNFYEMKKANYSMDRGICSNGICFEDSSPIGSYFRSQFKSIIIYDLQPKTFRVNGGLRYLKSELSEGVLSSYSLRFSQQYLGIEIGFEYDTPKFYNSHLTFSYTTFYLSGKITNKYDFSRSANPGYISYLSEPSSIYFGQEFGLKFTYTFYENIYFALGYQTHRAKVKPSSMSIRNNQEFSNDPIYDFITNTRYAFLGGQSFRDDYNNLSLEIGINL